MNQNGTPLKTFRPCVSLLGVENIAGLTEHAEAWKQQQRPDEEGDAGGEQEIDVVLEEAAWLLSEEKNNFMDVIGEAS